MKKIAVSCLLLGMLLHPTASYGSHAAHTGHAASAHQSGETADAPWVTIPAGARPAYMGIHGGTMPVSLMVSEDGESLLTFVGRTGNDFLNVLRSADLPVPSLFNATAPEPGPALPRASLSAGGEAGRMPVIDLGVVLSPPPLQGLLPFGLSEKPLAIEGPVLRPQHLSPTRRFRLYFEPHYLQPRRMRKP
ncbi:MAG: hypothetical protein IJD16_05645 [Desulfovibrio sp.]|nr:hypothetical protein [Desulfovibrio sp.]